MIDYMENYRSRHLPTRNTIQIGVEDQLPSSRPTNRHSSAGQQTEVNRSFKKTGFRLLPLLLLFLLLMVVVAGPPTRTRQLARGGGVGEEDVMLLRLVINILKRFDKIIIRQ